MQLLKSKYFSIVAVIIILVSFIFGFVYNENSAGAGGLTGDFKNVWNNIQIFKNYDLIHALKATASDVRIGYVSSRPPLIYILNILFNPFINSINLFLKSIFFFSCIAPLLFYFLLKIKYRDAKSYILYVLIACLIFLSPYFRTSSYWGLEENYAIISALSAFIFLELFLIEKKLCKLYFFLFFLILFSSLCVYFDPKFLIIPIICVYKVFFEKKKIEIEIKFLTILLFFLLSTPYIYFIYLWGNVIPTADGIFREVGHRAFEANFGYASTIISFYLFPFIFFKKKTIKNQIIRILFKNKVNIILITIVFFYISYLYFFYDFINDSVSGNGFIYKIANIIFQEDIFLRKVFLLLSFFISFLILILFIEKNIFDFFVIFYFLLISIFITPIFQEYYDPIIIILAFAILKNKININYKNMNFLFLYLFFFLICANIYYYIKLT
jgi:hypothetical protein